MKILDKRWFTASNGMVGVVLIENDIGQQSARISCLHRYLFYPVPPWDEGKEVTTGEERDTLYVADHGAKLTYEQARGFFPTIEKEKYKTN